MTQADFDRLRAFLKRRSGLDLPPEKIYLAESRLQPLCVQWRVDAPGALIGLIEDDASLGDAVVDAMATHETMFFRDRSVFGRLRQDIVPELLERRTRERRLRIWSAATATGQEAYSLAMMMTEMGERLRGWTVSILATDLSANCLARAKTGLYSQFEVQRGLPIFGLLRHFEQCEEGWSISPELRHAVRFRRLNLLDSFAELGQFDLVLCRNVLIYLDRTARRDLVGRLAAALDPGGVLCVGTAEAGYGFDSDLAPCPEGDGFFTHEPRAVAA